MASEIRVNSLSSRTGLSTVTFTDTGPIFSGITTFQDNSGFNVGTGGSIFSPASNTVTLGTNNAERLRIASNGNIGIGTDNPGHILDLYNSDGSDCLKLNVNGDAGGSSKQNAIRFSVNGDVKAHMGLAVDAGRLISGSIANDFCIKGLNSNNILFATNSSERLRIDSSGRLLLACTSPPNSGVNAGLQIQHTSTANITLARNDSSITDGNSLGRIDFYGNDGGTFEHCATIAAQADGAHAHGDKPMRLIFGTSADGAATPTERLRIDSSGRLGVGLASPNSNLHILGGSDSTDNLLLTLQSNGVANDGSLSTGLRLINSTAATSIHGADIRAIRSGSVTTDLTFSLYNGNSPQTETLRLTSAGNMGLGVTPVYSGIFGGSQRVLHIGGTTAPGLRIQSSTSNQGDFIIQAGNSGGATYLANLSNNADTVFYTTSGGSTGERLRINATGPISANPGSGDGDDFAATALKRDWNAWLDIFYEGWISGNNGWGTFWAGSTGAAYRRVSSDANPNEFVFVGSGNKRFTFDLDVGGNAYFDGSLAQNNYDYAEYFEWEDGNPNNEDRRGYSVFLNANGKIEKATSETSTSDIIGVISGTAAIIGDAAVYDWQGRYEIDEWGTRRKEQVTQVSWTDIDGTKHSYADENDVPSDVVVPDDASRRIHHRYIESSTYDSSQAYVPRDQRREWGIVGLLGKVRVRNDSPKHPNWKYIKTIAGKDLWLIK